MGNQVSSANSGDIPAGVLNQEEIKSNDVKPVDPQPIRGMKDRRNIVSGSPVAGSPLGLLEQGSVGSSSWFGRNRLSFEKDTILRGSSQTRPRDYKQPVGEKSYRNSSKIIHGYGPSGMAPLSIDKKEKTIPIMIIWPHQGKVVHLTGTFNNWKKKIRLQKSSDDFSTIIDMPPGIHQFKFIVDDEWKCSEDLPVGSDSEGNLVNCLEVVDEDGKTIHDGLEGITDDYGFERAEPESPRESYDCQIPQWPRLDLNAQIDTPPSLPSQLQKVLLNSKAVSVQDPHILPIPNHVSVNHLYACSIRDGVMAIGSTSRYKKKVLFDF